MLREISDCDAQTQSMLLLRNGDWQFGWSLRNAIMLRFRRLLLLRAK